MLGQIHIYERLGALLSVVRKASPFVELRRQKALDCVREFGMVSVLVLTTFAEIDVLQHAVELRAILALVYHACLQTLLLLILLSILSRGRTFRFVNHGRLFYFHIISHRRRLRYNLPQVLPFRGPHLHSDVVEIRARKRRLFDRLTVDLRGVYDYICHVINIHTDIAFGRKLSLIIPIFYGLFAVLDIWTKQPAPLDDLVDYFVLLVMYFLGLIISPTHDLFSVK